MDGSNAWDLLWDCWVWLTVATSWPFAYWMGKSPKMTDAQRWEIARAIIEQPVVMPDGRMQKAKLVWETYEAEPISEAEAPRVRPTIHGQRALPN